MEVASNHHHRDNSLSSFGSLYSVDVDSFLDDLAAPDPTPPDNCRPGRKRLGVEMAIIAATSPEIKALNLPITPSFPQALNYRHRRMNSNETISSCLSVSSCTSRPKGALTSLLASMDDVEGSPDFLGPSDQKAMHTFLDETDELVRSFQNHDLTIPSDKHEGSFQINMEDKEHIHPNLLHHSKPKNGARKKSFGTHRNASHHRPSKYCSRSIPRGSLHRRASYENLPSPAEIGNYPRVMRRAITCGALPFFPTDLDRQRSDHRVVSRSLNLTTGFR